MKAADLKERLAQLPDDADIDLVIPAAVCLRQIPPQRVSAPEWNVAWDSAARDMIAEISEAAWPYPTVATVVNAPDDHGVIPFSINAYPLSTNGLVGLIDGGTERLSTWFYVSMTPKGRIYVDPRTKTVVHFDESDDGSASSCRTYDLRDIIEHLHRQVMIQLRYVTFDKNLLPLLPVADATRDQLPLLISMPPNMRLRFRLVDRPRLSAALTAALTALENARSNAEILSAYRDAGGRATTIGQVLGRLRGAFGLTGEAQTLMRGIRAGLAAPDGLSPEDILAGMYP